MFHLGICEDNVKERKAIYDMVSHVMFKYEDADYVYFSNGQEVINAIENEEFDLDLLFLDIHMPQINGLATARYIRENQIDVDIIFVTVSTEHVFDGYKFRAFSYLLKPLEAKRMSEEIARYITERGSVSRCLHVNINGRTEQILLDRVLYFAAEGRKIRVYERNGEDQTVFYAKLGDVEAMLEEYEFVRCHQSYLVNQRHIGSFSKTKIKVGEEVLPISRKYMRTARERLEQSKGDINYGTDN